MRKKEKKEKEKEKEKEKGIMKIESSIQDSKKVNIVL